MVELLVVVAIIALLIALLLPSLHQARAASRLAVCGGNLSQIGIAIHTYALENTGYIPRGPAPAHAFDFSGHGIATNQLWNGGPVGPFPPPNPCQYNGAGSLLIASCPDPELLFCPADDTFNLLREVPKIRSESSAYGSYIYRQLDHLPADAATGLLDRLGANPVADVQIPVEALALDTISLGTDPYWHTNHRGRSANILFRDAAVRRYDNRAGCLALAGAVFPNPVAILAALDQLLTNADYAYRGGHPADAPPLVVNP